MLHWQASLKRRYFMGLNEVTKATQRRQTKCIIITPDLENVQLAGMRIACCLAEPTLLHFVNMICPPGGINDRLRDLLDICCANNVVIVYALSRRALGHAIGTKRPTAMVGIQGLCTFTILPLGRVASLVPGTYIFGAAISIPCVCIYRYINIYICIHSFNSHYALL